MHEKANVRTYMTNRNILLTLIGALRLVIEKNKNNNNTTARSYYSH